MCVSVFLFSYFVDSYGLGTLAMRIRKHLNSINKGETSSQYIPIKILFLAALI